MNPIAPPPTGATSLRTRRCARHEIREAIARCSVCGGSFCRECIVEHESRLLCSPCLERHVAKKPKSASRAWSARLRDLVTLGSAVMVLWILFYFAGKLLVSIPPELHDGTVWKRLGTESNDGS